MAQTIGVAGRQYGNGRVASMTKAINLENLSEVNTDFFVRLFLNLEISNAFAIMSFSLLK